MFRSYPERRLRPLLLATRPGVPVEHRLQVCHVLRDWLGVVRLDDILGPP